MSVKGAPVRIIAVTPAGTWQEPFCVMVEAQCGAYGTKGMFQLFDPTFTDKLDGFLDDVADAAVKYATLRLDVGLDLPADILDARSRFGKVDRTPLHADLQGNTFAPPEGAL